MWLFLKEIMGDEKNLLCRTKDLGGDKNRYSPELTLCQNAGGDVE